MLIVMASQVKSFICIFEDCLFHYAFELIGVYKRYVISHGTKRQYESKWSCCGNYAADAWGCTRRAHVCKEVMVSVRAEASPAVIVDNLEVTVFNALEISVFPGAQYEICVKITRELVDALHKYFSIKGENEVDSAIDSNDANEIPMDKNEEHKPRNTYQSALYIKYLRVGDINVEVSTTGFPVNLKGYNAVVAPFIKHGRVIDWPRLIWMIEKHAIWSVTKHTATSGFSQVLRAIFPSSTVLPGRLGTALESDRGNSAEDENNFWGDENDDSIKRGTEVLGIKPNKTVIF